jgi:rhamnogalacturonan endolyase
MVFGCSGLVLVLLVLVVGIRATSTAPTKPFLIKISDNSYIIGNDVWNLTIDGRGFGKKLWYRGVDLVGRASGHYVSYSMSRF